jgi:hypothetical protein
MNVISMMHEIHLVANSMIRESPLPNLALSANNFAQFVRIRALDQLNGALDSDVHRGSQQKMHMLRHHNKRMQVEAPLATMPIESSQKNPDVRFDHEQSATLPGREGDEISSRRGDESHRLQGKPQRLKAASDFELKLARVELVPFPKIFRASMFVLGKNVRSLRRNNGIECVAQNGIEWSGAERNRPYRSNREGREFIRAAEGDFRFSALAAGVGL